MTNMMTLSKKQIAALKEIGMIGSGNAASGLSKMLSKRVSIAMHSAEIVPIEDIPGFLGGAERMITAIYIWLNGDISGSVLLMCAQEDAMKLADMITGNEIGNANDLDEMAKSALMELTNITTGCYVQALAAMTNKKIMHSTPALATDMLGALVDGLLIQLGMEAEGAVVIKTRFGIDHGLMESCMLFLPDSAGLKAILEKIA